MVGLSSQQLQRRRMDITANNLANMTTTGFKAESLITRELTERPARDIDRPNDVRFVEGWALQRDMRTGPLERTGNPLDVAIEGGGFFAIRLGDETAYSRDGQFSLNAEGVLVNRDGLAVLDDGGNEIGVPPNGEPVTIATDGTIRQGAVEVGRIGVSEFATPAALEKVGSNLWMATDETPIAAEASMLRQGFLEGSNVQPILELTRMIEISRAYESASRMVKNADDLRQRAVEKIAGARG